MYFCSMNGVNPAGPDTLTGSKAISPHYRTTTTKENNGYNMIEMGSPYGWAPDIDCFEPARIPTTEQKTKENKT